MSFRKYIKLPNKVSNRFKVLFTLFILAVIISLLAPGNKGFKYQFYKGKPWNYELLTAPYDFPVYKSDAIITMERDSVRESVLPVYGLDKETGMKMLTDWKHDYEKKASGRVNYQYYTYVQNSLRKIYDTGVMSNEEKSNLRKHGHLELKLLNENNETHTVPISRFLTLKEAYELLFENIPSSLERKELSNLDLSSYLSSNVIYNQALTEQMIKGEIDKLSLSTGMVQAGERIVDRGEIVDGYTYNVLNSLKRIYNERLGGESQIFAVTLGGFLMVSCLLFALWLMLSFFTNRNFVKKYRNVVFLAVLQLLFISLTQMVVNYQWFTLYIIPYVMLPILLRTFFDTWTAFLAYLSTILIASIFVPNPMEFMVMQIVAGIVALSSLQSLTSRSQLIRCTFLVFVSYALTYMALELFREGSLDAGIFLPFLYFGINLIFLMFTYLLVYLIEKGFGYVSNISLVELSDINTPLLRQLSEVAPGTFQHSLQVSILATEAALQIGADVQLIRTGALYHDIGKMKNPTYFTENQGVNNPHELLPFDESARIIIRHVSDGIALAQKYQLPDAVIDFIRTHHGRGQAKYFYNSYYNQHPGETIDVEQFTYPGPNPFTKETGILMLADAVEASSRSLKEVTEEGLEQLVNKIVGNIISEGLLNDTPITFHDVQIIKSVFVKKLKTMYHARITYPDRIETDAQPVKA
ncbi:HD family phosphohydrolase [Porphyromonas macacae]|uniref:Predicted HD superfamily hydrolase n=1 Tax=Porphyromonas macacae TaxID=28115 RepID=A0A379DJC2_9PORP|nr:HDIG domain-containing metalloprotein [Porphyromonas macacae]SUB78478.1 Predicted HD superfamily hydrolase [Porphyromonas macacae]